MVVNIIHVGKIGCEGGLFIMYTKGKMLPWETKIFLTTEFPIVKYCFCIPF